MQLTSLDWVIVVVSLVLCYLPALFYLRRARSSVAEFFTSGQSAPWWLVGTSMVATTFSTDTPNLVTDFVRSHGVSYNWVWWAFLLTGMATVFFYAQLWRRSRVLTDLEFYELRYSGRPAAAVRGFRAVYLGLFFNIMIMATVTLAAVKIANVMLGWGRLETIAVAGTAVVLFAAVSGLWGVLATDLVQFVLAMIGVIAAAYVSLDHPAVGGLSGLLAKTDPKTLSLLPDFHDTTLTLTVLVIPLTVQWWSVWYPGAEPGGGSYIAQRILASRNERHALGATLWFNVAHYALRPWPWIIVALCSMLVFPTLADLQRALPQVNPALIGNDLAYPAMLTLLPVGMKGLIIASLFAAYRSTMETHLNWGSSYLVIDFYQRFLAPGRTERHYLWVSRALTAVLMILCGVFTLFLSTASEAFQLLLSVGAGTGLIYLLRWFWWRINAWSEISAMLSSFLIALAFFIAKKLGAGIPDPVPLLATVAVTTVVWITVTLMTPPVDHAALLRFYELTRPAGPGWTAFREESALPPSPDSLPQMLLGWTAGVMFVYAGLFGTGSLIYGRISQSILWAVLFVVSGVVLLRVVMRVWSSAPELTGMGSETSAVAARRPCTKAVILAAGRGTRMQATNHDIALTNHDIALTPDQVTAADAGIKAMIPVGHPFLDYSLSALADVGFTDVCVVVARDDRTIRDRYTGTAVPTRFRITFATQLEADGTADAMLAAEEFTAGEPFVVLNSDNYYTPDVLLSLRTTAEPACVGFSREGLLRRGDIPAERIAAYAILDVGADGYLRRIIEKPDASAITSLGPAAEVSMNCWRLTSEIFRACRDVPPSPRNEIELPAAVQYAIDVLGMRIRVIPADAPVLDLSRRADIPIVAARLRGVAVTL
ncbi:MAG TPA: sugar phosphate nucleotidyltransferase [Gemmatimonadaceae bacterium]|nr:sugar phosphate nucleotidyltransferase [Gemmatimonadaceae bacterium]